MTEKKFRVWDEQEKEWFRFPFVIDSNGLVYREYLGGGKVEPRVVLMQFTGLKDGKGKEIWEGDIIQDPEEKTSARVVEMLETCWNFSVPCRWEVVGNIYQNPDLIQNHA